MRNDSSFRPIEIFIPFLGAAVVGDSRLGIEKLLL